MKRMHKKILGQSQSNEPKNHLNSNRKCCKSACNMTLGFFESLTMMK